MKKIYRFLILVAICFLCVGCKLEEEQNFRFYDNAAAYTAGEFIGKPAQVKRVKIDWYGGTVELEKSPSDSVFVFEEENDLPKEKSLYTYLDEGVLRVKYCQSGYCGKIDETQKNLQVEIPSGVEVEINGITADVYVGNVDVKSLSIKTEKGCVEGEYIVCQRANIETDSGYIGVGALTAESFVIESDSGDVHASIPDCQNGKIETDEGNVTLYLQGDVSATIVFESESGTFSTERKYENTGRGYFFATDNKETPQSNSAVLLVKTEKGNLRVQ